jgi:hypothetical protein
LVCHDRGRKCIESAREQNAEKLFWTKGAGNNRINLHINNEQLKKFIFYRVLFNKIMANELAGRYAVIEEDEILSQKTLKETYQFWDIRIRGKMTLNCI